MILKLQNKQLKHKVMQMAKTIGKNNFVLQQRAISDRIDQRPHLISYAGPSSVICGDIDELTPSELSIEMAKLLPNCELMLLDSTGHLSTMEAPKPCLEAMQRLIERAG